MITPEATLLASLLLLCIAIAFVAYWKGVNAGEQSQKARIEHLLNELDESTELLQILAAERHPAGRALRVVREDGAL
jgi:hypothetical protein